MLGSWGHVLLIYLLGGLTFIPLILALLLAHLWWTSPVVSTDSQTYTTEDRDTLRRPGDDDTILKSGSKDVSEKAKPRSHESDVAASYFAVCREYVPGGINGKPPERKTPAGAVVATESPSVYQSMYRSIFDRNKSPTIEVGKGTKKARNVFFVVLRHGHLILFDDAEQLEVRHVISMEHHSVSIYAGGGVIPEGELWIRRNAICLERKPTLDHPLGDASKSKPFYLFSENCSDKEDFYFALLQNQAHREVDGAPVPQKFEIKDIISLVQALHSSEEHLQTRWINAMVGRLFLSLYKTPEVEQFVRRKITKKIARVKKPAFLTDIVLQKIHMGERAPSITNPRLKDLNVDGDCAAEADITYAGNFTIEVAATARIDLGARFKARQVNLVLAVVLKRLEGHGVIRFKPPPSNRMWFTFETMPKIDMSIKPIVSSRQITYNIILRAIESRIREVIAETVVLPNWDDIPFTHTSDQQYRGGIWEQERPDAASLHEKIGLSADVSDGDAAEQSDEETEGTKPESLAEGEYATSNSTLQLSPTASNSSQKPPISPLSLADAKSHGSSSATEAPPSSERRRGLRSSSFASASNPVVSMDTTTVDAVKAEKKKKKKAQQDAASAMMAITNRSQPTSPISSPFGSPPKHLVTDEKSPGHHATNSRSSEMDVDRDPRHATETPRPTSISTSPAASISGASSKSASASRKVSKKDRTESSMSSLDGTTTSAEKRQSLSSLGAATATAAKKWGLGVLNRNNDRRGAAKRPGNAPKEGTPEHPIGRGRPLPPPGTPLPRPEKTRRTSGTSVPARKQIHPPPLLGRQENQTHGGTPPPLPVRSSHDSEQRPDADDGVFVVQAPPESEPASPSDEGEGSIGAHAHDEERSDPEASVVSDEEETSDTVDEDQRPQSQRSARGLSGSPEEGRGLPSWLAAQEGEERAKSLWVDSEQGHM
ncbi:MAG: hypothetical protein M1833_007023 [Piccolia ochrophora]|nr:MAG: hypothetical protein M1833_007023 [Piccolia ochrophora]